MSDSDPALKHFEAILELGKRMKEIGVAIYEHEYYSLVFGSWTVVVGKRKNRIKFSWDGRDGFLDISEGHFPDSSCSTKTWNHLKNERIDTHAPFTVYDRVEECLRNKFTV